MKKTSKRYLVLLVAICLIVFLIIPAAVFAYDFPSTNQLNKDKLTPGYEGKLTPYVELVEAGVGYVNLNFVGGYVGGAFFEYRADGVALTSGTAHPVVSGDFIYPGVWVVANTIVNETLTANEYVEIRLCLGGERDWDFDWTRFDVLLPIDVSIDIKPGSYPNSINLKSKGVVPVAVLTTETFDSSTIDPTTVEFAGAAPVKWHLEDIDKDGDIDML
ncbi:MAG: hypothetical protein JXC36_08400, partial [Candidatus Atribacteria bacterium]|nr:hypothetical protein [Candidatus Atribacteria bacterium]